MANKRVLVLLATYNGERFIRSQIDSILNQKGVDVHILASDDRSTDKTAEILREYSEKYPDRFAFSVNDQNKHFTYNFLDMIFSCDENYDLFALSDQDDVWEEDKLLAAANKISPLEPTLYMSALKVTDAELNVKMIMNNRLDYNEDLDRHKAIDGNLCTGCTAVFNGLFLKQVRKHYPENLYLHDYWIFLIAMFTGNTKVIFDDEPKILYRQHGGNMVGQEYEYQDRGTLFQRLKEESAFKKFKRLLKWRPIVGDITKVFYENYGDEIEKEYLKEFKTFAYYRRNPFYKLRMLTGRRYKKYHKNLYNVLRVIFNRF